jgi:hypothetical protein
MLEADALDGIVQLDVDAEVVRVELQRVARRKPAVLGDVHRERRDGSVDRQLPVPIAIRPGAKVDPRWGAVMASSEAHLALYCIRHT